MKALYDQISFKISSAITKKYSTSFSLGIYMLDRSIHESIYSIYGFVRVADEIVDSFHGYDKEVLLDNFERETFKAISDEISTNPVLHAFQITVNKYQIDHHLIKTFLNSMRMDLAPKAYNPDEFQKYILGSAEVVGLMCLKVFVNADEMSYKSLKPAAMKLGAAFQKVNFLRDLQADYCTLGRSYFPEVDVDNLSDADKRKIESSIQEDFDSALIGIKQLPSSARFGVYTAYIYYYRLFKKIKRTPCEEVLKKRIRISNLQKILLLIKSYVQLNLKLI